MSGRNYFYGRVSSREQREDRQLDAIKELNIDERDVYIDRISGKTFDRPEWNALKRSIRRSDVLYIKSIDRMGRKKSEILEQWKWLIESGIDIVVLDMPLLDTRKYKELNGVGEMISDLVLQVLSWLAEEERLIINQRQREGVESAKIRGIKFGRPKVTINDEFIKVYNEWQSGSITAVQAMNLCNMKRNTFYRRVKEFENDGII